MPATRSIDTARIHATVPAALRSIRAEGVTGSLAAAGRNMRRVMADRLLRHWDRLHNVDTVDAVPMRLVDVFGPDRDLGEERICTSPKSFDFIMQHLPQNLGRYTFIDIGAGKARTLLLASRYGFAKVTGVEAASEQIAISWRNISTFGNARQMCRDVTIEACHAADFVFPNSALVVYFNNSFAPDLFDRVLGNLIAMLRISRQECYVVYASSCSNTIGWARPAIAASGYFTELPVAPMPFFFDAEHTIHYAIYRAI